MVGSGKENAIVIGEDLTGKSTLCQFIALSSTHVPQWDIFYISTRKTKPAPFNGTDINYFNVAHEELVVTIDTIISTMCPRILVLEDVQLPEQRVSIEKWSKQVPQLVLRVKRKDGSDSSHTHPNIYNWVSSGPSAIFKVAIYCKKVGQVDIDYYC